MKNLYRVLLIVSLVSECGFSRNSFSQTNSADYWRRYLLGSGRYSLMQLCNKARAWNRQGNLFFDEKTLSGMNPGSISSSEYQAALAGLAAAMFEVCPDVR